MHRIIQAKVHKETPDGTYFLALVPGESLTDSMQKLTNNGILKGELRIDDGRHITAEQRKKAYATLADIADHTGYMPEELKEIMKYRYVATSGDRYFSFSNCSVTTAMHFITHLLNFALEWDIPLSDNILNRADDINAALYATLMNKKCIICGVGGEIHHVDVVGMGRNRLEICHLGMHVMCLCREHHDEAHLSGKETFNNRYHVYGIKANHEICKVWKLNHQEA